MTVIRTRIQGSGRPQAEPAPHLLQAEGPQVSLGAGDPLIGPVAPDSRTLFGPRGACLLGPEGPLWVADTGHHRLLGWERIPTHDNQPADWIIGQPSFEHEGRNALGSPSRTTLNVPTGVAPFGERGLMVCDAWNNRVLIWLDAPTASHVPADIILGQGSDDGQSPNRDPDGNGDYCAPDTMHWPFQALTVGDRLYVADAGNRRVLIWDGLPTMDAQPADRVLGQPDLHQRSDNGGESGTASGLRWPHDLAMLQGDLVVTDAGNNRIMIWRGEPTQNNQPADIILGQKDAITVDHNQGNYWPDEHALNMPYAVATAGRWVLTGDTANSRLLGWRAPLTDNAPAVALTGQPHFKGKGDNAWGPMTRTSVCWPYGLQVVGRTAVVCDTGNHRILLWDLDPDVVL